jgi:hypothetical protein
MSSILKALKKLEKDTINSKPEQLRIDSRILNDSASVIFTRTKIVLFAISIFMCGGGATYCYMSKSKNNSNPQKIFYSSSQSLTQPAEPTVVLPSPEKTEISTTAPNISAAKSRMSTKTQTGLIIESVKSSESPKPEIKQPNQAPTLDSKPPAIPVVPSSVVFRPAITVNGIAFQEGGNENMAMINGNAVTRGTIIEGVMVEDIQKDRVLFSQGGEKFEIKLNKSNK